MMKDYLFVDEKDDFVELSFSNHPNNSKRVSHYDPAIGQFDNVTYSLPFIEVNDIRMSLVRNAVIKVPQPANLVTFAFHLNEGDLDVCYNGSGRKYAMQNTSQAFIYDDQGCVGRVGHNSPLRIMNVFMPVDYFVQLLQGIDKWSDRVVADLLNKQYFVHPAATPRLTPAIKQTIHAMQACLNSERPDPLQLQSAVFRLISQHIESIRPQTRPLLAATEMRKDDVEKLIMLREYIENHFLEHKSLSDFAQLCTLNEFKLKKGFRQLFGTSVFQYVNSLRMAYAREMLCEEEKELREVATLLGYKHVYHFTAAYKKYHAGSGIKV